MSRRIRTQKRHPFARPKGTLIELSPHRYEFVPDWAQKRASK